MDFFVDDIGRRRASIIRAFIAALVLGHLTVLALDIEVWPFSRYPMYSHVRHQSIHGTGMAGVTDTGDV